MDHFHLPPPPGLGGDDHGRKRAPSPLAPVYNSTREFYSSTNPSDLPEPPLTARPTPSSNSNPPSASATKPAYRPPALRTHGHMPTRSLEELSDASGEEEEVLGGGGGGGGGTGLGYRRARAGTMPSSLDTLGLGLGSPSGRMTPEQAYNDSNVIQRPGSTDQHVPSLTISRPGLRHTASSAATLVGGGSSPNPFSIDQANRIRSGSLTLGDNTSNAFGTAFGGLLQNAGGAGRSSLNQVTNANGKGLHPVTSHGSSSGSGGEDAYAISQSTMDYLGLAGDMETPRAATFGFQAGPVAPTRNPGGGGSAMTAQRAMAVTPTTPNAAARNRASTVSNFARPAYKSAGSLQDLISAANLGMGRDDRRPLGLFEQEGLMGDGMDHMNGEGLGMGGDEYLGGGAGPFGGSLRGISREDALMQGLNAAHRPRATTISMLDQNSRLASGGTSAGMTLDLLEAYNPPMVMQQPPDQNTVLLAAQIAQAQALQAAGSKHRATDSLASILSLASSGGLLMDDGAGGARRKQETGKADGQTPTRSLWLGNLDVMTSAQDLMAIFEKYGAIESLRLLPEKSCAFVNYISRGDAVRAKEDVHRQNNVLASLSDTPIKIGYGKIDSVPTAQPSASTKQYSISGSSASSVASMSDTQSEADSTYGGRRRSADRTKDDEPAPPSRAIWIGNVPTHITGEALSAIFSPFGKIESARVLSHKQCGFINYELEDSAISACTALDGRDLFGGESGLVKVSFARAPVEGGRQKEYRAPVRAAPKTSTRASIDASGADGGKAPAAMTQANVERIENYGDNLVVDLINKGQTKDNRSAESPPSIRVDQSDVGSVIDAGSDLTEQQVIMAVLSQNDASRDADVIAIRRDSDKPALYYSYIPVVAERSSFRKYDPVALKDIRRRLDGGYCTPEEVDNIAKELMEDMTVLASDYIGNTIVQKLYANTSKSRRLDILQRIGPQLALTGTHKNGTWAAQKIIEVARSDDELAMIGRFLSPYVPPLAADTYGNYLVSGCLRFGNSHNAFVYEAMANKTWDIAQTRFGARCMRTCLESPHTSHFQKKRMASGIIMHCVPLATNPNGALLLTWLMDANELPGRFGLLASRITNFIPNLSTHKLAALTVLRVVNQKQEPEASRLLLDAIFRSENDHALIEIMQDPVQGAQVITKIMGADVIPPNDKPAILASIRRVLEGLRNAAQPGYKRLYEECGLPVPAGCNQPSRAPPHRREEGGDRGGGGGGRGRNREGNSGRPYRGQAQQQQQQQQLYQQYGAVPDLNQMIGSMQAFHMGQMPQNLSPLMMHPPSFGQAINPGAPPQAMSPTPTLGSMATPHAQLMSPTSDPFNPFASPTQVPRNPNAPVRYNTPARQSSPAFDLSPTLGGLGMQPAGPGEPPRSFTPFSGGR